MKRIYVDVAAAAPVRSVALRAFKKALPFFANPASAHEDGRQAKVILETARKELAHMVGAKPEQVIFTSGATEANVLAIEGTVRALVANGRTVADIELMYHPGAHSSVVRTMEALATEGVITTPVPLKEGELDLEALAPLISSKTALISLEVIAPETGQRHDVRAVGQMLQSKKTRLLLHVDASQVPLVESFERTRLGADLLTLDAQKAGGVRGIGALVLSAGVSLMPVLYGGGQERGLRSGTPSPALAAAFVAALKECDQHRVSFVRRAQRMRTALTSDMVVNEGRTNAPHIVNLSFAERDTDYLAALLDAKGYAVATRSACETDSVDGSRAVLALTGDHQRARATLRISWDSSMKEAALVRFKKGLVDAVSFLDRTKL